MVKFVFTLLCAFGYIALNADVYLDNGNFYFENCKYEEAIQFYNKYLNINPNDALITFQKGKCLFQLGRYKDALNTFYLTKKKYANDTTIELPIGLNYYIAKSLFELKEYDDKRIILNIDNSNDTLLADAQYLVALYMDKYSFSDKDKKNYQYSNSSVLNRYEKVIKINPTHKEALKRIQEINDNKR